MNVRSSSVVLAAVGGGAILVASAMMARDEAPVAGRPGPARAAARQARGGSVPLSDVKLELLQRTPGTLGEPGRNPFRFEAGSTPTSKDGVAPPDTPPRPPSATAPRVTPPAGPPSPPPITLKFIGLVEAPTQAGRVAILSDGRGNVFYGKEGDTIEGQYKMLRVSPELIELSYLDGRGRQTIRLSGQ